LDHPVRQVYFTFQPDPDKPVQLHDFFMAASSGKINTVTKYLEDGGDVNIVDSVSFLYTVHCFHGSPPQTTP